MKPSNNNARGNQNPPGQHFNDKQANYQHSNERNRDNIRDNTRDKQYKDHDEELTNDENYQAGHPTEDDMDFRDKKNNLESGQQD